MPLTRYINTPFSWAVVGFAIGVALGVNFISVVLVALGLGAFVLYMYLHGPGKTRIRRLAVRRRARIHSRVDGGLLRQ